MTVVKRWTRHAALGLLACAAYVLLVAGPSWAADFTVNDDTQGSGPTGVTNCATAQYASIQEAIDAATTADGDTINVCAGTYNERPVVNKSLTINGAQAGNDARTGRTTPANESVVQSADSNNVIFAIGANDVTIDGFTVQGTGDTAVSTVGISAPGNVSGYEILNNIVQENTFGIYANGTDGLIENNLIQNNDRTGAASGNGIYADQGSTNITINENEISGDHPNTAILFTTNGGSAPNNDTIEITNNDITGNRILLFYTDNSLISGNTITDSSFSGVQLGGANNGITIQDNAISGSGDGDTDDTFNYPAIRITDNIGGQPNAGIEITGNSLVDNEAGISIRDSDVLEDTLEVNFNRIFGNNVGIDNGDENDDDAIINAINNWWGCNEGPNKDNCDTTEGDNIDFDPWLIMDITADPTTVAPGGTSDITVSFDQNSDDENVAKDFPDGVTVDFTATGGSVNPTDDETENAIAETVFTAAQDEGRASVTGSLDAEDVTVNLRVLGDDSEDCDIVGTPGNDTLTGTNGDETICGFGGNDTISGLGGDDDLRGGDDNDRISGGNGDDTIDGGDGDDRADGGGGADDITGGNGEDNLRGQDGNDTINGGANDDTIFGGAGEDTLSGAGGNDNVSGDNADDTLSGGSGDDTLKGGTGTDTVNGNTGNDILLSGTGASDVLAGGNGDDRLNVRDGTGKDSANGGSGSDTCASDRGDNVTNCETNNSRSAPMQK